MKRKDYESEIDQRYKGRAQRRISNEPNHRGEKPLGKARKQNLKVTIRPGTADEEIRGPNSTQSDKPR